MAGGFGVNFKGVNLKEPGRAAGIPQLNASARERALDKEQKKILKKLKKNLTVDPDSGRIDVPSWRRISIGEWPRGQYPCGSGSNKASGGKNNSRARKTFSSAKNFFQRIGILTMASKAGWPKAINF